MTGTAFTGGLLSEVRPDQSSLYSLPVWLQQQAATALRGWQQAREPNEALAALSFGDKLRIRLLRFLAVFAFEKGVRQTLESDIEAEPYHQLNKVTEGWTTNASLRSIARSTSTQGSAAVVIPVLIANEVHLSNLRRALTCLANQSTPPAAVYVVDDGSSVPLESQLTPSEKEGLTIIRSDDNEGPAAARNRGLQAARDAGVDFVCFTDSDCLPEVTWVENIVANFEAHPDVDIFGGITSAAGEKVVDLYHDAYGTLNGRTLSDGTLLYVPTCNMAIRLRTIQISLNPDFPEAAYEDVDFCFAARDAGAKIMLARDVRVSHAFDASIGGIGRQFNRYGRTFPLMVKLHPNFISLVHQSLHVPSTPLMRH